MIEDSPVEEVAEGDCQEKNHLDYADRVVLHRLGDHGLLAKKHESESKDGQVKRVPVICQIGNFRHWDYERPDRAEDAHT